MEEKEIKVEQQEKLFIDINPDNPVTEIESFCVNCEQNGLTRILLTKIPFFKEIIIMAFDCEHCGYKNSEVQAGQELSDTGIHFELKDLNRRVIKSEHATIKIPECEFEIPAGTQKAKLTTVEGFLTVARDQLDNAFKEGIYDQLEEDQKEKIQNLIKKLDDVVNLKFLPITFIMDDPSGNSFIENPFSPQTDPYIKVTYYERTKEMAEKMGYMVQPKDNESHTQNEGKIDIDSEKKPKAFVQPSYYDKKREFTIYKTNSDISAHLIDFTKSIENNDNIKEEALRFPTNCHCCMAEGENYMCLCTIPFFKEIIITCFKCAECGFKTTEVKGGGGISEKATKLTLKVKSKKDLNRDLFKSESSRIVLPELEFETDTGSMGSMFTTVEGLIEKLSASLSDTPFTFGDSSEGDRFADFIARLRKLLEVEQEWTLIIDDPLSNCFIHSDLYPEDDPQLIKEVYERTWEQNEELGVNDMNVDNYIKENEENTDKKEENEQK